MDDVWRSLIASALAWEQAHVTFDRAVAELPAAARGRRPERYPHSPWELVEHIRIAQADFVSYLEDADYAALDWPDGYWPSSATPPTASSWDESVSAVRTDRERLQEVATRRDLDLTATIPWGGEHTYLRTLLLAIDHTAYHVGQIVTVRRLLDAWPAN